MSVSEKLAWILLVFLAVYGSAQLIRRFCLWATRCPHCARCYRVAVPREGVALVPLMRCLQSQSAWGDLGGCRYTLLLLSQEQFSELSQLDFLLRETPQVLPVTAEDLPYMLQLLTQDIKRKE